MGKSTTPTKWFKAVKKAFRSPSKERLSPRDKGVDANEKLLVSTKHDFPPAAPTPHPLPSFEIIAHKEVPQQQPLHYINSTTHWPLPALPGADTKTPAVAKPKEVEEEPQHQNHQVDDDNDSTLSEEDEAVLRIQQRWNRSPLALKGLIRLQALVRGQLVRRQAATTLRTMEAIVRIQALFRGRRVRMSSDGRAVKARIQSRSHRAAGEHARQRDDLSREMESETSEADLHEANKRKRRTAYLLTQQLKRSTPNRSSSFIDCDPDQPHEGWAWLELWTNAKAWEGRQQLEAAAECKDSKDYIEIIPGNSHRTSGSYVTTTTTVKDQATYSSYGNGHAANGLIQTNKLELKDFEEGALKGIKSTTSPKLTTPSPAVSEDAAVADGSAMINIPPVPSSPQASEASVGRLPEEDHSSLAVMEPFVLPQAHVNGDDVPNGRSLGDSFSTSNDVHQPATGPEAPAAVANGTNKHQENTMDNNDNNNTKEAKKPEESPVVPSKRAAACRYMAATESAKAKFRSSSNPKSRGHSSELLQSLSSDHSPAQQAQITSAPKHRTSLGGSPAAGGAPLLVSCSKAAVESPGKSTPVAFGTRKTTSNTAVQNRRSPSPKIIGVSKEKPRSIDATAHGGVSPARRNSLGIGDDKRWRT